MDDKHEHRPSGSSVAAHDNLALLQDPSRWPLASVLALVNSERRDFYDLPQRGFLARDHGARVYLRSVHRLDPADLEPPRLERSLVTTPFISYVSFEAMLADGWWVD